MRKARFGRVVLGALLLGAGLAVVPILPEDPASATLSGMPPGFVDEVVVGRPPVPDGDRVHARRDDAHRAQGGHRARLPQRRSCCARRSSTSAHRVHDNHDRGLLGITVHPDFPLQPYVYLLYTHDPTGVYPDDIDPNNTGGESHAGPRPRSSCASRPTPPRATRPRRPGPRPCCSAPSGTLANIGDENDGRNHSFATCMNPQTANGTPVRDCIASDEDSHTIGTVAFASRRLAVHQQRRRLELHRRRPAGVARPEPRQPGRQDPAHRPDDRRRPARQPVLRRRRPGQQPLEGVVPRPAQPVPVRRRTRERRAVRRRRRLEQLGGDQHREGRQLRLALLRGRHGRPGRQRERRHDEPRPVRLPDERRRRAPLCAALYDQGLGAVKAPVYAYNHTEGQGGATSGGAFYTGTTYPPQYRGAHVHRRLQRPLDPLPRRSTRRAAPRMHNFGTDPSSGPVQLITGPDTNIYWMRYDDNGGEVRRIRYVGAGNTPPVAEVDRHPDDRHRSARRSRSTAISPTTPTPRTSQLRVELRMRVRPT